MQTPSLNGELGRGLPWPALSVPSSSCIWNLFLSTLLGSPLPSPAPACLGLFGSKDSASPSPGVGEGSLFSSFLLGLREVLFTGLWDG